MASLTGQLVAETYKALLKTIDNDILTASEKQITDGFGGGSNVFIDSQGFLRANKYKVTNGLATQFLKADGSLDSNTYLTGITSSQIITALGYTPVTSARTLTINGTTYDLSANRSWTVAGTAAVWGNISGTLADQTDLQTALNAKYNNPAGTISQYIRGDGSLATFPTLPGGLPTGGTAGQILAKIDATDYNTHWIDNYATQTKNEVKLGQTLAKGAAVYVSSANGTNMIVSAASNTTEATSSKTFGLLETGGITNDLVKCVTFGLIAGLDTSTAQAGDPVWLGVNGALIFGLANKPVAPAHMVYIGVVTRVQSNNGEIFVNIQNGFEIEELHDVLIQSKANNQGLFYESSTGLWKNKSIATVLGYTPQAELNGTGFVKASGTTISYDNSTYLTTTDAASTYQRLDKMVSNLLASDTEYPNSNAVLAKLALKADAANPVFTGNMTISGAEPKLYFTDTDNNPDYTLFVDSGYFYIYDQTAGATKFQITPSGNAINTGTLTSASFIKSGGTSSQYLMADGSVSTLSGLITGSGGTNYLPKWTSASALGNSLIYDHGDAISIATTSNVNAVRLQVAASSGSWISGTFAGAGNGDKVVIGNIAGPTIGGHNSALSAWSTLSINPDGGNVMIGSQTDLGYKLYVNGSVKTTSILSTSFTDGYVTWDAAQFNRTGGFIESQWAGSGGVRFFGNTAYPVTFESTTGRVTFSETLNLQNTLNITGNLQAIKLRAGSSTGYSYLRFYNSADASRFYMGLFNSGGVDYGLIDGSGYKFEIYGAPICLNPSSYNVLIGSTTDGGQKLQVNGQGRFYGVSAPIRTESTANNEMQIVRATTTNGAGFGFYTNSTHNWLLGTAWGETSSNFVLYNAGMGAQTMKFDYTNNDFYYYGGNVQFANNMHIRSYASSGYIATYANGGGLYWGAIASTNQMHLNSTGNLLIGTTTDAGYKLFVNGNFAVNTGSFHGILGSIQASWGGSTAYPTLYGNTADRWVMYINPHVSYTQNGYNGFTGSMTGATIRMASDTSATNYWDVGIGVCSVGADKFAIGRNGTALFTITNSGNVTATAFFESSDIRLKTLIDGSAQVSGIENLEAKLYEKNGKLEFGYFAQDAEKLMPFAVEKNADGFLTLSYREVHTAKIARLEKEVAELKAKLNAA